MQPAHHAPTRTRMVVLHERLGDAVLRKLRRAEGLTEESATVREYSRLQQQRARNFCLCNFHDQQRSRTAPRSGL